MDEESSGSNQSRNPMKSHSSQNSLDPANDLLRLMTGTTAHVPYRSKFEIISIDSGKSRQSRDSDLLNRLAQEKTSSKASSKSLNRQISQSALRRTTKHQGNSSNGSISEESSGCPGEYINPPRATAKPEIQAPKIHNCVCFVAGECLNYNCNCFLSPYPCAPECCPQCLTLKSNLPLKVANICSCKKTKCLKLYCQCLSKGVYCSIMCRCELCQNYEHSCNRQKVRQKVEGAKMGMIFEGCSCQKSMCVKKYCECFSQGLKCTSKCICVSCANSLEVKQPMEIEEPGVQFQEIDFFGTRKK